MDWTQTAIDWGMKECGDFWCELLGCIGTINWMRGEIHKGFSKDVSATKLQKCLEIVPMTGQTPKPLKGCDCLQNCFVGSGHLLDAYSA